MNKLYNQSLKPRIKLWLASQRTQESFGDGKWHLLETIGRTESLQSTCQELGISYRKAWGDLKKAEQCLDLALVTRSRGGSSGGKTVLSEHGKKWIRAYAKFHKDIDRAVKSAYEKHIQEFIK